jgi:hypothetical protein
MCVIEHIRLRRHSRKRHAARAIASLLQCAHDDFFLAPANKQTNKQTNKRQSHKPPHIHIHIIRHPTPPCEKRTAYSAQVARPTHPKASGMAGEGRGAKGLRRHSNSQCPPPCSQLAAGHSAFENTGRRLRRRLPRRPPAGAARCPASTTGRCPAQLICEPQGCGQVCKSKSGQ